jgi:hypothetical protein
MEVFLLHTGAVDNYVENSLPFVADARPVGILLVCACVGQSKKINKIKAFYALAQAHLSDVSKSMRNARV